MRKVYILAVAMLFLPLVVGHLHCAAGEEPETVIVPVGEPSGDDPYGGSGDMCADESDAVQSSLIDGNDQREPMVLLTFIGTRDVWPVVISLEEFIAVEFELDSLWDTIEMALLDHEDVDELQQDLCAPIDQRSDEGSRLYEILKTVLAHRMEELESGICQ